MTGHTLLWCNCVFFLLFRNRLRREIMTLAYPLRINRSHFSNYLLMCLPQPSIVSDMLSDMSNGPSNPRPYHIWHHPHPHRRQWYFTKVIHLNVFVLFGACSSGSVSLRFFGKPHKFRYSLDVQMKVCIRIAVSLHIMYFKICT